MTKAVLRHEMAHHPVRPRTHAFRGFMEDWHDTPGQRPQLAALVSFRTIVKVVAGPIQNLLKPNQVLGIHQVHTLSYTLSVNLRKNLWLL